MLLNQIEKALVNNPVRALLHRHFEAKRLLLMGGAMQGGRALEIGCGQGVGVEIINDLFKAEKIDAFDLDPEMIRRAEKRLEKFGDRINLWTGDVTRIQADDNSYDAVFDFGVIHHVQNWQDAVKEIHRVLKPGGRFYAEEVLIDFILHPIWKRILHHPEKNRFSQKAFSSVLEEAGFEIIDTNQLWGWFGWFVAKKFYISD